MLSVYHCFITNIFPHFLNVSIFSFSQVDSVFNELLDMQVLLHWSETVNFYYINRMYFQRNISTLKKKETSLCASLITTLCILQKQHFQWWGEHIYKDWFLKTSCEIEGKVGMYTYWKEQGILENIPRTFVFWHTAGVTLVRGASFCSHVERSEHLLWVRSGQDSRVLGVQHRSRYD